MIIDLYCPQANDGTFDIQINATALDFQHVSGNDTAFLVQLLMDRRTNKAEIASPRRRGGWIGDVYTKQNGYEIGSFLYLKNQSRNNQSDMNEVAAYAKQALDYFVSAGEAKQVKCSMNGITLSGEIIIDTNTTDKYSILWGNIGKING